MPYCSHCGHEVSQQDAFCPYCGGRQPVTGPAEGMFSTISARNASVLCYIPLVGWIPAIVVLASARFRQDRGVRFHAFQGLYLFVAWLVVDWAVSPFFSPGNAHALRFSFEGILKLGLFALWIYMIVKTSRSETCRLPLVGELAERSVQEQHR